MRRSDWTDYIRSFHERRPGITEEVLTRCIRDGRTPYQWLIEGVEPAGTVLDLACGSAPTRHRCGAAWVGIDASLGELRAAHLAETGRVACGDARALPLRTGVADGAVCSMALMLVNPLANALRELYRVLKPSGTLRLLLPTTARLTLADRRRYGAVAVHLRSARFWPPSRLHHHAHAELKRAGFTLVTDDRARFTYPIHHAADARLLLDSLYLPGVDTSKLEASAGALWHGGPTDIGIALRRTVATKP